MVRASKILGEAIRRAPEGSASKPAGDLSPSRLARTLMGLLDAEPGAKCQMRRSVVEFRARTEEMPHAKWHRAVYSLADNSLIAVHDGGADIAKDEEHVIRYPNGEFASVFNEPDSTSLLRGLSEGLSRIPDKESDLPEVARMLQFHTGVALTHPFAKDTSFIAMSAAGEAIVASADSLELVPPTMAATQAVIDHARGRAASMSASLGLSESELMEEVEPTLSIYNDAVRVFEATPLISVSERAESFSPR